MEKELCRPCQEEGRDRCELTEFVSETDSKRPEDSYGKRMTIGAAVLSAEYMGCTQLESVKVPYINLMPENK